MNKTVFRLALCAVFLAYSFPAEAQKSPVDASPDAIYKELNGIDKSVHREIRQTAGTKPATTSVDQLKTKYDLVPRTHDCPVYFGQPNARSRFSQSAKFPGAALEDVIAKLKAGNLTPDDIPIQFLWIDGKRVTINNRSLTVLYKAGMRPTKLIDRTDNPSVRSTAKLVDVLRRLEGMGGKPSTEMLVRTQGMGRDAQPKEASHWDAPIGEIVSMPDDVLTEARTCEHSNSPRQQAIENGTNETNE